MVSRRAFLQAAPLGALSLAGAGLPWSPLQAAAAPPAASAADIPVDRIVSFMGDNVPVRPAHFPARLQELLKKSSDVSDLYLGGGAVEALEQQFAERLGKQDAVFMPTGTMANQIAIRLLAGDRTRVLLQKESHVYRDEVDAVAVMSSLNPIPVDGGASNGLYDAVAAAFAQSAEKPFPLDIGAVSIESPVRRLDGAAVSLDTIVKIAGLAKSKGAGTHLDGARMLLMHGTPGFDVRRYSAPFDTVYVSLYKYLGAPFGAILAGEKALMARARDTRHVFGGAMFHGWMAALIASDSLASFGERFTRVHAAAGQLLGLLAAIPGIEVQPVEQGTNIVFLKLDERLLAGLPDRLKKADIYAPAPEQGRMRLTFNETLLRKSPATIAAVFKPRV
ncbi:MAG: beta-eliminating lyase-related protein [Luteibacter sp.]